MKTKTKPILKITITGKSALAIAACLLFALLAALFITATYPAQTRETLAEWQPEMKPDTAAAQKPTGSTPANEEAALIRSNGSEVAGGSGGTRKEDPKYSYFSRGWNADDQWWQLSGISTKGFGSIEISFACRGSNTGPKNFSLQYSTDASEWLPLTDSKGAAIKYSIGADNKFHRYGPFPLTAGISDIDRPHIRFIATDKESVNGETVKSAGTNSIADIAVTGVFQQERG